MWVEGCDPHHANLAPMPGWLLREVTGSRKNPGHTMNYWRNLIKQGILEGERNTTIASLRGHLLWHGVGTEVVQELLLWWNRVRCRPALFDDEVVRTVYSIARLHKHHTE